MDFLTLYALSPVLSSLLGLGAALFLLGIVVLLARVAIPITSARDGGDGGRRPAPSVRTSRGDK